MKEHAQPQEVNGMDSDGWSNSPEAKDAPQDVTPDVTAEEAPAPGWSNRGEKVVASSTTEDKAVKSASKRVAKK